MPEPVNRFFEKLFTASHSEENCPHLSVRDAETIKAPGAVNSFSSPSGKNILAACKAALPHRLRIPGRTLSKSPPAAAPHCFFLEFPTRPAHDSGMNFWFFRSLVSGLFWVILGQNLASAGNPGDGKFQQPNLQTGFPFEKGAREIQAGIGFFGSLTPGTDIRPGLDFALFSLRHGWMLTSARADALSGTFEMLADLYTAGVTGGPGNALAGGTLLLRYNLVPRTRKFAPYFQVGAGGLYNDVYQQRTQRVIGAAFEFNLEASLGLRYLCTDRCALFLESGVRHISNAGLARRNNGLNSFGMVAGLSFFY